MIDFPANEPPVDEYVNHFVTPPATVFRWKIPNERIIVGGSVISPDDWARVQSFGVTHVLNVDSRGIEVPRDRMRQVVAPDSGLPLARALLTEACSYARDVLADGFLYVSDLMGATRAPAFAYAILRSVRGYSHEEGLIAINRSFPHSAGYHWGYNDAARAYVGSIDLWVDEGGLGQ